jgi:hypothetical protein
MRSASPPSAAVPGPTTKTCGTSGPSLVRELDVDLEGAERDLDDLD